MTSAVTECGKGMKITEAAHRYNVPITTLLSMVKGTVFLGCKPGTNSVFPTAVEDRLVEYLINMGSGLSQQEVMCLAFKIAETSGINTYIMEGK